jgi:hypothetical protein
MENSHTLLFQQGRDSIMMFVLVWIVFNEGNGKQESLNHYRIIMDVDNQKALQERLYNNHKVNFLERQCNAAMKNCSAQSNVEH